ncbi:hypothetical protein [Luedemannella helvata]|uniref:Uncharacterized protein n=1 Tax=Luedemannella helvata TaxID=349315 RepID=A0ABN2JTZ7_9ACTN
MKYLLGALLLVLTAGAVTFLSKRDPDASGPVQADHRIVAAPATGAPAPSHQSQPPAAGGPVAVGFTLLDGKLYLVTAKTRKAAEQVVAIRQPVFACGAEAGPGSDLEAWPMRNAGGGGVLPGVAEDGTLLTAPHDGSPVSCTVQDGGRG